MKTIKDIQHELNDTLTLLCEVVFKNQINNSSFRNSIADTMETITRQIYGRPGIIDICVYDASVNDEVVTLKVYYYDREFTLEYKL